MLLSAFQQASDIAFCNSTKGRNNKSHIVPGWNDHVSNLHSIAREAFLLWRENGKMVHYMKQ